MFEEIKKKRATKALIKKAENINKLQAKVIPELKKILEMEIQTYCECLEDKENLLKMMREAYDKAKQNPDKRYLITFIAKDGRKAGTPGGYIETFDINDEKAPDVEFFRKGSKFHLQSMLIMPISDFNHPEPEKDYDDLDWELERRYIGACGNYFGQVWEHYKYICHKEVDERHHSFLERYANNEREIIDSLKKAIELDLSDHKHHHKVILSDKGVELLTFDAWQYSREFITQEILDISSMIDSALRFKSKKEMPTDEELQKAFETGKRILSANINLPTDLSMEEPMKNYLTRAIHFAELDYVKIAENCNPEEFDKIIKMTQSTTKK